MNQLIPQDWVIGTRKHPYGDPKLGFFTYYEKNGKMNCQTSWESWSDTSNPIKFKNDFVSGWKIEDHFNQRSGESNRKLAIIVEPRTGYKFEMDLSILIHLIQNITIKDGILQGKFCLTNRKSLISEAEFNKMDIVDLTAKNIKIGDVVAIGKNLSPKKALIYLGKKWITNVESKFTKNRRTLDKAYLTEREYHIFVKSEFNGNYGYIENKATLPKAATKIRELSKKELEEVLKIYNVAANEFSSWKGILSDSKLKNPRVELILDTKREYPYIWKYRGNLFYGHHNHYSTYAVGCMCSFSNGVLQTLDLSEVTISKDKVEECYELKVVHD